MALAAAIWFQPKGNAIPIGLGGGQAVSSCLFSGTAAADGCATALSTYSTGGLSGKSLLKGRSAFFGTWNGSAYAGGYAQQYNQTYAVLPQWNVAGVDYTVGVPANVNGTGVLKDWLPGGTHVTASLDAGLQALGCVTPGYGLNEYVVCTGASCSSPTISGYDFSTHGSVAIVFDGCSGPATYKNNYWQKNLSYTNPSGVVYSTNNGSNSLTVTNNYFDGNLTYDPTNTRPTIIYADAGYTGNVTVAYNAFAGLPNTAINVPTTGTITANFNYAEGSNYNGGAHGEIYYQGLAYATATAVNWNYNTWIMPDSVGGGMTGTLYMMCTSCAGTIAATSIDHNVFIGNMSKLTASIDNGSGGAGNVLTVTAWNASVGNPIGVGFHIYPSIGSNTCYKVSSLGTGTGGTGTYNLQTCVGGAVSTLVASTNMYTPPSATVGATFSFQASDYSYSSTINYTNNFHDPTGASHCALIYQPIPGSATLTQTGNVGMIDGASWSTSGAGVETNCNGTHS